MAEMPMQDYLTQFLLPDWEALPDFGLYLDQMLTCVERFITNETGYGLTGMMINNYVKAGLMDKPSGKKYSKDALAQLLMICELKLTTSIEVMKRLLHPEGGPSTEAIYKTFQKAQQQCLERFSAEPSPLVCALESAAYQAACRRMIHADSPQPVRRVRKVRHKSDKLQKGKIL